MKQVAVCLVALALVVLLVSCGGGSPPATTVSGVQNAALVSNTFSGSLQIVNTQTDTTDFTNSGVTSTGQVVAGQPVTITVGNASTYEILSPDGTTTAVYDPTLPGFYFITNKTATESGNVSLSGQAAMGVFSPNSKYVYAPVRNALITGLNNGGIEVVDIVNARLAAVYAVPNVHWLALSPDGNTLLAFSDTSDSVFLLNLSSSTVTTTEIPGFARPVAAFFSSDSSTAFVLNCGPECGSTAGPPSVSQLNISSMTIKANVPVGGATVGLMTGSTLWVAGYPGGANGTLDSIDTSSMTRTTANSIAIGDGYHWKMALSKNNKLYIGSNTCANVGTGCLSAVNLSSNTATPSSNFQAFGPVTGLQAIPGRDTMYVIEGGYLHIYDTDTDTLQSKQLVFVGSLFDVVQIVVNNSSAQ